MPDFSIMGLVLIFLVFCKIKTIFGLTWYPDISRRMLTNCFACGFWLHCCKVKQTVLFCYNWFHVFSKTRTERKQLSMALVSPPKVSVDLEFALGNPEGLKRLFSPFPLSTDLYLFFSCHSFYFPSPSPSSLEVKRNNRGRLGRRGWKQQRKGNQHCIETLLYSY